MKRSETSETVGNMIRPKFVQPAFLFKINISAQRSFFFEGPKVSKGKWLETVGDRTFARQKTHVFTQFSNIFHEHVLQNNYFFAERRCDLRLFPTVSPWTPLDLQKKNFVARKCFFTKKCGLDKFWPDHVSDCFRPFPTVSDRFIFSERLIGPVPFVEGWSSASPCKPWRLSFFVRPLCVYTAPNIASWPWYPIFPKNHKIPGAREI